MHCDRQVFGFLGGTFDPIHFGHLNLAIEMLEKHKLDRIFFCPASHSPEKIDQPIASADQRFTMVRLAIEPISSFSVTNLELQRSGPSYTIETIRQLKMEYPEADFHLILGEDLLKGLTNWKDVEVLFQLAPPLVGSRHQSLSVTWKLFSRFKKKICEGFTPIPLLDISSSALRKRLKEGAYCGHLIPAKVLDYIERNHLYL